MRNANPGLRRVTAGLSVSWTMLWAALLLLQLVSLPLRADELEGRVLSIINAGESAVEALIRGAGLKSKDKVTGSIDDVKVTKSNERQVQLQITYTDYQNAEFEFELLDANKRQIRNIQKIKYAVPAGTTGANNVATIDFQLHDTEEGYESRSSRIKVIVTRKGKRTVQGINVYALDKQWAHEISAENLVVKVKPTPVGDTASWVRNITRPASPQPAQPVLQPIVAFKPIVLDAAALANLQKHNSATATAKPQSSASRSARVSAAQNLANKNKVAIRHLPQNYSKIAIANYQFKQPAPQSTTSTEPSNQVGRASVDLLSLLKFEDDIEFDVADILSVARQVYPDANANSGVFYFVPRGFRLSYNKDIGGSDGLGFRITYDRRRNDEDTSTVRMAASFDSSVDLKQIQLAERILTALDRADNSFMFKPPLRPLPLVAPPEFSFSGALAGHVDDDGIAVVALSDTLEGIDISWSTDPIGAQNIRSDLIDGTPITGVAAFDSPGSNALRLIMPARVEITDPNVYSAVEWTRDGSITNNSPLPIVLQYVHAIVIEGNRPRMYSWAMGDAKLPRLSKLELDRAHIPPQVDQKAERVWIQYRLDHSCSACLDEVVSNILRSGLIPETVSINVTSLTPLESTGASELWIDTRSRFLEVNQRSVVEGPQLRFVRDREEFTIQQLFEMDRADPATGDEWPLLEYRITAVMPSGQIHEGSHWIPVTQSRVAIGEVQVGQSLGFLPGAN